MREGRIGVLVGFEKGDVVSSVPLATTATTANIMLLQCSQAPFRPITTPHYLSALQQAMYTPFGHITLPLPSPPNTHPPLINQHLTSEISCRIRGYQHDLAAVVPCQLHGGLE